MKYYGLLIVVLLMAACTANKTDNRLKGFIPLGFQLGATWNEVWPIAEKWAIGKIDTTRTDNEHGSPHRTFRFKSDTKFADRKMQLDVIGWVRFDTLRRLDIDVFPEHINQQNFEHFQEYFTSLVGPPNYIDQSDIGTTAVFRHKTDRLHVFFGINNFQKREQIIFIYESDNRGN